MVHELEESEEEHQPTETKENGINEHLNESDDVKENIKVHSAQKEHSYVNLQTEKEGSSKHDGLKENTENDIGHGLEKEAGPEKDMPDTAKRGINLPTQAEETETQADFKKYKNKTGKSKLNNSFLKTMTKIKCTFAFTM